MKQDKGKTADASFLNCKMAKLRNNFTELKNVWGTIFENQDFVE